MYFTFFDTYHLMYSNAFRSIDHRDELDHEVRRLKGKRYLVKRVDSFSCVLFWGLCAINCAEKMAFSKQNRKKI